MIYYMSSVQCTLQLTFGFISHIKLDPQITHLDESDRVLFDCEILFSSLLQNNKVLMTIYKFTIRRIFLVC